MTYCKRDLTATRTTTTTLSQSIWVFGCVSLDLIQKRKSLPLLQIFPPPSPHLKLRDSNTVNQGIIHIYTAIFISRLKRKDREFTHPLAYNILLWYVTLSHLSNWVWLEWWKYCLVMLDLWFHQNCDLRNLLFRQRQRARGETEDFPIFQLHLKRFHIQASRRFASS